MLQANMFKHLITRLCDFVLAKITKKDYGFQIVSFNRNSLTYLRSMRCFLCIPDFATRWFISPVKSTIVQFEPGFHRRNAHVRTHAHTHSQP